MNWIESTLMPHGPKLIILRNILLPMSVHFITNIKGFRKHKIFSEFLSFAKFRNHFRHFFYFPLSQLNLVIARNSALARHILYPL